jgi:hypothetical protein
MIWKVLALIMLALPAYAGEQVRFYAPDGRSIGTATRTSVPRWRAC